MLDRLPPELVDNIFDDCDRPARIRILQCSQKFRQAFGPRIYRHNVLSERCSAARWAVIHCRDDAVAFRVVEASVYAGMDVWAPQFAITRTDMFSGRFVSKFSRILGQSAASLSPFAIAVLKRREELVTSILSMTSATQSHLDKLLAPDITTYLGKLTSDQPSSSSQLTPLHIASATGLDAVVKRILEETPSEAVSRDARGRTPLSYAVQCPLARSSTIQLLLRQQTDVYGKIAPENQADLLLKRCCRNGLFRLATRFLEYEVRCDLQHLLRLALLAPPASLPERSSSDRAVLIRRLIRRGANPNGMVRATDVDVGKRPLLFELAMTSYEATKCLLDIRGVDVNILDKYGQTALSRLLLENHSARKTVALLLERGAKLQPHSLGGIIRDTTFRTHQELVTLVSRRENTFELFRLLYKHCNSHSAKDQTEANFLASIPWESEILARMSDSDIKDIRKGNVFPISPYFDLTLAPKGHHGSQGQRQQDVAWE
ncbi:hypothetical protein CNYM01_13977 [Colletotrichum nymphaeae SA-01]|uniref:F-box domain-containing protein n=1 Tax=Colletotrichum nymphaeae SA-01 TaxID=1460502 RepID=A0A135UN27_9PEZI|nr:hypothetical protein CNYM01_13977 [Colletotrichum nymphaeae SA-01]